jgi:hypothetical protein
MDALWNGMETLVSSGNFSLFGRSEMRSSHRENFLPIALNKRVRCFDQCKIGAGFDVP